MTARTSAEILKDIRDVRQHNIAIYRMLSDLVPDRKKLGWVVRKPGDRDVTMEIVEHAMKENPTKARQLVAMVSQVDERAAKLGKELSESTE
jgi:hypothetical protein